ncbi:MAG: bifunctional 2-polyprenyl-6-hydroxyphenol methylase/3-demethylubiquinol 3-O-methyltransferase UbiG [Holosporales bacterium]
MTTTIDTDEVEKFSRLAATWWDTEGAFKPLHRFNPVRVEYIRSALAAHFKRDEAALKIADGLSLLDVGCGGGLIAEPMARLGAAVTAIDASEKNIAAAKIHGQQAGLTIDYRCMAAENLADTGAQFDVILCLEVVEHVADPLLLVRSIAALLKPGGLLVMATLNRTPQSFALVIVGAEYVLRWLPRGTHQWSKFIKPSELSDFAMKSGLVLKAIDGVQYNPLSKVWRLSRDTTVNYLLTATKN